MEHWTRRKFFRTALLGGAVAGVKRLFAPITRVNADGLQSPAPSSAVGSRPILVSSSNGLEHLAHGMDVLKSGGDTLDAVLAVVTRLEDDPEVTSVGLGGLPNEDGIPELDASVMHGPTRRAGAVAALRNIKNPSLVAKAVMEKTDHVFLVGSGALAFAKDEGFKEMDLLTEKSRTAWLVWKAAASRNWSPGLDSPDWKEWLDALLDTPAKKSWREWALGVVAHPPTGTINCLAVDAAGNISGTTTTSGLAWKIAGRVGDSPVIGAGLYVDGDVGGAGSTGRGEENIRIAGGHTIVEQMRRGVPPADACMEAVERVARNYKFASARLKFVDIQFYAVNKDGQHGGATLWELTQRGERIHYAVCDAASARLVPCAAKFSSAPR